MNASTLFQPVRRALARNSARSAGTVLAAAALLVAGTGAVSADRGKSFRGYGHSRYVIESLEVSDLHTFPDGPAQQGAVILTRDYESDVVDIELSTTALTPGDAYSIWIVAFNRPWHCSDECGLDDLPGVNPMADPRVRPSVFWGGGFLADSAGAANASLKIVSGRTTRPLFGGTEDFGLERLFATEIHVVVRTHGPALDPSSPADAMLGTVADQIGSTATGGCNPDPSACQNVLVSIHPARD